MAYTVMKHCDKCASQKQFVNGKCSSCAASEERAKMAAWNSMKKSEKLLDLHRRLLRLEAGPPTY